MSDTVETIKKSNTTQQRHKKTENKRRNIVQKREKLDSSNEVKIFSIIGGILIGIIVMVILIYGLTGNDIISLMKKAPDTQEKSYAAQQTAALTTGDKKVKVTFSSDEQTTLIDSQKRIATYSTKTGYKSLVIRLKRTDKKELSDQNTIDNDKNAQQVKYGNYSGYFYSNAQGESCIDVQYNGAEIVCRSTVTIKTFSIE